MKNNKKVLVAILTILGILLTITGITVAWFTYARNGTKENTITSGDIKFHYQESNTVIDIDDMMPMTDAEGKGQTDYFEFTITAKTSRTLDIPYYITVRRTDGSYAALDDKVKVYLTKVDSNNVETPVLLTTGYQVSVFDDLDAYTNSAITIPAHEKALYTDTVLAETTNYTQKYRLRIWLDESASFITQTPTEAYCEDNSNNESVNLTQSECVSPNYTWHPADVSTSFPLNNKTYGLRVNVYGEGNDIGEMGKQSRENTNISTVLVGEDELTSTDGVNYNATYNMPSVQTMMIKTIEIDTVNEEATVEIENITHQGEPVSMNNKVRRLSTAELPPLELEIGTNIFKITVTSADKTKQGIYYLTINVSFIPDPSDFATDSWETIALAATSGNTSVYPVGATKLIDLGSLGTHILRVANKTACTNETSHTACGFVIEFADIITTMQSNSYDTVGYKTADVYNYINGDLYNALPNDLRKVITKTTVISSDYNRTTTFTTSDYMFLFDSKEIYGEDQAHNSFGVTRRLDYYASNSRVKYYNNTAKEWYLRGVNQANGNGFYYVDVNGLHGFAPGAYIFGVSPAFKVG